MMRRSERIHSAVMGVCRAENRSGLPGGAVSGFGLRAVTPRRGRSSFRLLAVVLAAGCRTAEPASPDAMRLLSLSQEALSSAASYEVLQTADQTTNLTGIPPQQTRWETRILVDLRAPMTVLQFSGDFTIVRRGDRVALRIGDGPWREPTGPYAAMSDLMADPFSCPAPPTEGPSSPRWAVVGSTEEAFVVETVGDSAIPFVQSTIEKGLAPAGFRGAEIRVLRYNARHLIAKHGHRLLRVEQDSEFEIMLETPDGGPKTYHTVARAVSEYTGYDETRVEIPADAEVILRCGE